MTILGMAAVSAAAVSLLVAVTPPAGPAQVRAPAEISAPAEVSALAEVSAPGAAVRWDWPLQPRPQVLRGFGVGPQPWSPGHRGVDLAAADAGGGAAIRAPARGVVSFAGMVAGRPVISIDHGGGMVSSLEPVLPSVRRGDQVSPGQQIGTLTMPGGHCRPRLCVHWGVRMAGRYIDPLRLVGAAQGPIILLPDPPRSGSG